MYLVGLLVVSKRMHYKELKKKIYFVKDIMLNFY